MANKHEYAGKTLGKANGNGPWHLLSRDGSATLCGVKRFSIRCLDGCETFTLCSRCAGRAKGARGPVPDAETIKLIVEDAERSLSGIESCREAFARCCRAGIRRIPSGRGNALLGAAYAAGFSMTELAELMGITRQAVYSRIKSAK